MSGGEAVALGSIRLGLACYAAVLAGHLNFGPLRQLMPQARWPRVGRALWTMGLIFVVAHVIAAMWVYHHGSHAAAVAHVREQTRALVGIDFAGGIYFNYLLVAIWLVDVVWWWLAPRGYLTRSVWLSAIIHGYLLFIVINGAIVFAAGPIRWVGVVVCGGLAVLTVWRLVRKSA